MKRSLLVLAFVLLAILPLVGCRSSPNRTAELAGLSATQMPRQKLAVDAKGRVTREAPQWRVELHNISMENKTRPTHWAQVLEGIISAMVPGAFAFANSDEVAEVFFGAKFLGETIGQVIPDRLSNTGLSFQSDNKLQAVWVGGANTQGVNSGVSGGPETPAHSTLDGVLFLTDDAKPESIRDLIEALKLKTPTPVATPAHP